MFLPSLTGFYRVLPGFTGFYRVLPGFTGFSANGCLGVEARAESSRDASVVVTIMQMRSAQMACK